ncbi:hypothetical protein D5S17_12260 [Pseudonocardiaceae bacterium YIM PH 21723]|nr:hypothetical protein D5S17_12260 [Pseudonocardiaceae bacterium YIM PH 21723]
MGNMTDSPRPDQLRRLVSGVLDTPGELGQGLRGDILDHAVEVAGSGWSDVDLVPALTPFVDRVTTRPRELTGRDFHGMSGFGYTDDAIFEVVLTSALGAGLARLHVGLAAVEEVGGCV